MRGIGCCAMQDPSILQKGNTGHARQFSWLILYKTFSSRHLDWCYLGFEVETHVERGRMTGVPITQLLPALRASSAAFRHLGLVPRVSWLMCTYPTGAKCLR